MLEQSPAGLIAVGIRILIGDGQEDGSFEMSLAIAIARRNRQAAKDNPDSVAIQHFGITRTVAIEPHVSNTDELTLISGVSVHDTDAKPRDLRATEVTLSRDLRTAGAADFQFATAVRTDQSGTETWVDADKAEDSVQETMDEITATMRTDYLQLSTWFALIAK